MNSLLQTRHQDRRIARHGRRGEHVMPVWVGHLLISPLRRLCEDPRQLLTPYISSGMRALDLGCAMGYYTLPMARLVGPHGRVVAIDLQPRMLEHLRRRLRRAGLDNRVQTHLCAPDDLGLGNQVLGEKGADFALAAHVIHEAPDAGRFLAQVEAALKPGGRLLLIEPKGHVGAETFADEIAATATAGFAVERDLSIRMARGVVLRRTT